MNATIRRGALGLITVGLGAAGTAKLAGADFTAKNFARWGSSVPCARPPLLIAAAGGIALAPA